MKTLSVRIETNPFYDQEMYSDSLKSNGAFSLKIPVVRLSSGRIEDEKFNHDIVLFPGDELVVEINGDTIRYTGKGAEKNNFLYALERAKLDDRSMSKFYNQGKLDFQPFADSLQVFVDRRIAFLQNYPGFDKLEPAFREWFEINTQVDYDQNVLLYPMMKGVNPGDSVQLSPLYDEVSDPAHLFKDKYVVSPNYLSNMNYFMFLTKRGREILEGEGLLEVQENPEIALRKVRAKIAALMPPKTRDYFMASEIIRDTEYRKLDSAYVAEFRRIASDTVALNAVERKVAKYNKKQALIGQPLHPAFSETMLRDTADIAISFGEMIERYKGKVVYLDIWSLGCGPCIAEMPKAKALKEKLAGQPVVFVYLTYDNFPKMWPESFEKTFTTENHYRIEKSFDCEMLKFLEVTSVPCYMIFDKEGKLVSYSAERPGEVEQDLLDLM